MSQRFGIMEDIMWQKAQQCKQFKDKLVKSGAKCLVHNMECDAVWGFGEDGLGGNNMGKTLMCVRDRLLGQNLKDDSMPHPCPEAQSRATTIQTRITNMTKYTRGSKNSLMYSTICAKRTSSSLSEGSTKQKNSAIKDTTKKPTLLVVGNSNVRGLSAELNARGANTTGYVFSGTQSTSIRQKLKMCSGAEDISHVFLHTGDIDARTTPQNAINDVIETIDEAMKVFNDCRILVNTLPENITDQRVKQTVMAINKAIEEKCKYTPELSVINSKGAGLRDSIHFTATAVKDIASKVLDSVHYRHL